MKDVLGHYTPQQLLFMYQDKLNQAAFVDQELSWRKEQLEADADLIFEELRSRGFFFNESNLSLLNAYQETLSKGADNV